jgi:hypothetical protein
MLYVSITGVSINLHFNVLTPGDVKPHVHLKAEDRCWLAIARLVEHAATFWIESSASRMVASLGPCEQLGKQQQEAGRGGGSGSIGRKSSL